MSSGELVSADPSITLVELVDRLLDKGVVVSGEVTIAVADVDLIQLGLRVLLSSVETIEKQR
jgi:gas vesicle structural protein